MEDSKETIYPWSKLQSTARHIIDSTIVEWNELLQTQHREEAFHQFLAKNAGLFFLDNQLRFICLSKIRLGADHVIDFAVAVEGHSRGLSWNLVEIELPTSPPYTKEGIPSARLSRAIQQIQDWKRWIQDNRREARKLFPTIGTRIDREPNFSFTIIIGNRTNSFKFLEKRNELAQTLDIEIRSFDYFTSALSERWFGDLAASGLYEQEELELRVLNELANPFASAIPDNNWRECVCQTRAAAHFTSIFASIILKYRPVNNENQFRFFNAMCH